MDTFTLERDGDLPITFDGLELGHSSSQRGDSLRWFEVTIYRTAARNFIVAGVGRSSAPDEVDRHWAVVCDEAAGAIKALMRVDDEDVEYLTRTARDALTAAAGLDDELRDALPQRVA